MGEFQDKAILITGGGSGIGLATASRLLSAGARVVLAGRSPDRLGLARKQLDAGDRVITVPTDVASTQDLDRLMAEIRFRIGRLHGVFANAGVANFKRSAEATEADYDQIMGTNFKGAFFTVQKALPLLADGGSVVLNGSWLAHRGLAFTSLYAASKAAVVNLARTLAPDLAGRGIRVNTISPGIIVTEMFERISSTAEAQEDARRQVPAGRLGRPEDIAEMVAFLLSPRASYITGQEMLIDGGLITANPL